MPFGIGLDVPPDTTLEDDPKPYLYCGSMKAWPKSSFNSYQDVLFRDFVLCRPCDRHCLSIRLGHTLSTIDLMVSGNYGTFFIE